MSDDKPTIMSKVAKLAAANLAKPSFFARILARVGVEGGVEMRADAATMIDHARRLPPTRADIEALANFTVYDDGLQREIPRRSGSQITTYVETAKRMLRLECAVRALAHKYGFANSQSPVRNAFMVSRILSAVKDRLVAMEALLLTGDDAMLKVVLENGLWSIYAKLDRGESLDDDEAILLHELGLSDLGEKLGRFRLGKCNLHEQGQMALLTRIGVRAVYGERAANGEVGLNFIRPKERYVESANPC